MTVGDQGLEFDAEIDFRRWGDVLLVRRWVIVAGLVVGLALGALYSLSGGAGYHATVAIKPGQPYNPDGSPVLSYSVSPLGIEQLVGSESGLRYAAAATHVPVSQLRGHTVTTIVSVGAEAVGTGSQAMRGTVLVLVTVSLPQADQAEDAANAIGAYVAKETEGLYVKRTIAIYGVKEASLTRRLNAVTLTIENYNKVLASPNVTPLNRLELVSSLDDAIELEGTIQNNLITNQNELSLSENLELSQIVNRAVAVKPSPPSRRSSLIFGGLIGLLTTGLAVLVIGLRKAR